VTVIRVNPSSVQQYGSAASQVFADIHAALVALTNDVVNVRYFGPNAVSFKTECGNLAADFAKSLHTDIAAMADAVRVATSNIASSLGGQPISITVEAKAIVPPTPASVDYVDVDTSALEGLQPVVRRHFDTITSGLKEHHNRLTQTDWEGNAKETAVSAVSNYTNSASQKCNEAQQSITKYISDQIAAVRDADRA
jgi:uncharacterized protein YukE